MININELDHITITSSNPEKSIHFYQEILGLKKDLEWPGELTMLRCGSMCIAIGWWTKGVSPEPQPRIKIDHFAFRVDKKTFENAPEYLKSQGVKVGEEVDQGICRSLYIKDPDGNTIELACYEIVGEQIKMPTKPNS